MAAHRALDVIERPGPAGFEALIRLVKRHFDVPVAALNRIDEAADELVAEDLQADPALRADPRVASTPWRFVATRRLRDGSGRPVAVMVIAGDRPRDWTHEDHRALDDFAALAELQWRSLAGREEAEAVAERTRELTARKAFAEGVIRNVPAGVSYLDRDLIYRMTNARYAEDFLRMRVEDFQDRYIFDVLPGTESQIEGLLRGVLETGEPYHGHEFPFLYTLNGEPRQTYWDFVYYPARLTDADEVNGILVLTQEVSERVERQQRDALVREERDQLLRERIAALEEAHVLKDQFLSILSHELRTPLNGIQGFGSVLEDGLGGELNEQQLGYVRKILTSSDAMLGLVNNLLDMSRVQAGVFSIVPVATDLRPLIEQSAATERAVAAGKGLQFTATVPADLPPVAADPVRVAQILRHLVGNAIKYTPPGGAIALRAGVWDGAVCLEVADSGPGIDPGRQADIFEPFTQIDMSRTRAHGGLGLGLPIVKALVAAHGGAVEVVSAPGKGATFRFTLPLAKKPGDGVD